MTKLIQQSTNLRAHTTASLGTMSGLRNDDITSVTGNQGGTFRYQTSGRSSQSSNAEDGLWFAGPGADDYWYRAEYNRVNACWFDGVDPSGVADSTTGLQNAINYVCKQQTGGDSANAGSTNLYLPGGKYIISAPLSVPVSADNDDPYFSLTGDGWHNTIIQAHASSTSGTLPWLLEFDDTGGDSNSFWHVNGICFRAKSGAGQGCIDALMSAYFTLDNCALQFGQPGLRMRNWSNVVRRCRMRNGTDNVWIPETGGIVSGGNTVNDLIFAFNSFASNDYGIRVGPGLDTNNIKIIFNQFDGYSKAAINYGGLCNQLNVSYNYFEGQGRVSGGASDAVAQVDRTTDGLNKENASGAIVAHPPTSNNNGINGTINDNHFVNCNSVAAISVSGCRYLKVDDNSHDGTTGTTGSLVHFDDPTQVSTGPLPYTVTQYVRVSGSCYDAGGGRNIPKLVEFDTTDHAGNCGVHILDRGKFGVRDETCNVPFVLNDPTNSNIWIVDTSSTAPTKDTDMEYGGVSFNFSNAGDPMSVTATFTKTMLSPLSGCYLKFFGDVYGSSGDVHIAIDVNDGGRGIKKHRLASFTGGPGYGAGRNGVMYLEPIDPGTPTATETVSIRLYSDNSTGSGRFFNFAICSASFDPNNPPVLRQG